MNLLSGVLILLIPFSFAGVALMNAGLGRSRNAAHSLMSALGTVAVASLAFVAVGLAWDGHAFLRGIDFDGSPMGLWACYWMFSAALAALIPLGAGSERWRLGGALASAALMGAVIYPAFSHWVVRGAWLSGVGRGFVDSGGAAAVQASGGLTALAIVWILGPRRGKYSHDGMPSAIPGHNVVFVLFGAAIALPGWLGLNAGAAVLFYGGEPGRIMLAAVNTVLTAGSALLATALITKIRFGKPDASLSANGWTGGLAASSACAAFEPAAAAIMVGLIAGVLVTLSVEWLELHLDIDDPGGAISVHGIAGLWGVLSAGLFGRFPAGQLLAQAVGVAALLGFVLPVAYGVNLLLDRIIGYRVSLDGERAGLDLHELGANAYPELASHLEDFTQR